MSSSESRIITGAVCFSDFDTEGDGVDSEVDDEDTDVNGVEI